MFDLRSFVMKTIRGMIGNEPDYKVMEYALGWYTKSILTDDDLMEVESEIEEYRKPIESVEVEIDEEIPLESEEQAIEETTPEQEEELETE